MLDIISGLLSLWNSSGNLRLFRLPLVEAPGSNLVKLLVGFTLGGVDLGPERIFSSLNLNLRRLLIADIVGRFFIDFIAIHGTVVVVGEIGKGWTLDWLDGVGAD